MGTSAALPPLGSSDRQAAHYYRARHARPLPREAQRKGKVQAAEKIIAQLLVFLELARGELRPEPEQILQSLRRHSTGLGVCLAHPSVPMANSTVERAQRSAAVARKNFYGRGAAWSGELAGAGSTRLATLRQRGLCSRKYFPAYLEACARAGGRAPENLEGLLPWKGSAEKRAANQAQGRPS